jgi:hypothetical protein
MDVLTKVLRLLFQKYFKRNAKLLLFQASLQTQHITSGCDNLPTLYVPEVRQYYGLVLLCFQQRRYAELLLSAYLDFAGIIVPWQAQGIQNRIREGI